MRQSRYKGTVGTVAMLLVLSTAMLGLSYGLWSKVLTIQGTVNTGRVDARWSGALCTEFHPWPFVFPITAGEVDGKNVGSTSWMLDPEDDQVLLITVDNAYPSYSVDCKVQYLNDGSVPVIVRGIDITEVSPNLHNCVLAGLQTVNLTCDELEVVFVDGVGAQVDPGESMASNLSLHLRQPAEQDSTYEIEVRACLSQWNEPADFEECITAAPVHDGGGG